MEFFAAHRVPKLLDEDTCCWRTRRWAVSKRYYKTLRVTLLSNFVCRWCKEDFPITSHLALHHFDRSIQFSDSWCFFVLAFLLRIVSIGLQFNGSFWSWRQAFGGVLISNHPTIKGTRAKKWYFPQNFVLRTRRRAVLAFLRRMEFYATHRVPKLLDEDTCCWSTRRRAVLAFPVSVENGCEVLL